MSDNAVVIGVYQSDTTPDSYAEKAYDLANDVNAEGFHTWAIYAIFAPDNAPVGGTYQSDLTPDSYAEKAYDLVNDVNAEGFNAWAIYATYANTAPDAPTTPGPADGATVAYRTSQDLSIVVTDPDGDTLTQVAFYNAADDSLIGTDTDVASGGTATVTWDGVAVGDNTWYAKSYDGTEWSAASATFTFTVLAHPVYYGAGVFDDRAVFHLVDAGDRAASLCGRPFYARAVGGPLRLTVGPQTYINILEEETMLPARRNIKIYAGIDWSFRLYYREYDDTAADDLGDLIDLTNYDAVMEIHQAAGDGVALATLTVGDGITLGGAAGTIDLFISATDTAALDFTNPAVFDLVLINEGASPDVSRVVMEGEVYLKTPVSSLPA